MGTFYYFATDLSRYEEGNTEFGGILKRLVFDGNVARAEIIGPPNPIVRQQQRELRAKPSCATKTRPTDRARSQSRRRLPFTITWNRDARTANIEIQGQTLHLSEREWSRWVDLDFASTCWSGPRHGAVLPDQGGQRPAALRLARQLASERSAGRDVVAGLVCRRPLRSARPVPHARAGPKPHGRSTRSGSTRQRSWKISIARSTIARRRSSTASTRSNWDLLVGVIETTDRVQHMMWRLIDPQHPMYDAELARRTAAPSSTCIGAPTRFVGEVLERLEPGTTVMIVSDHGFHSFRWSVNLNTWLVERGYMALQGQMPGEKKLDDLFGGGTFWENVDWSRTRAYAMGLGQIYVNLKGREGRGIVDPGAEYDAAPRRARHRPDELSAIRATAPASSRNVYKRSDIYSGPYFNDAADLQVGLERAIARRGRPRSAARRRS